MKTHQLEPPILQKRKFGITERKKAELDELSNEVLDAQNTVVQLQAVVNSLTQKSATYNTFFIEAENNRAHALSNKNLINQVVQNALDLLNNSETAFDEMVLADAKTKSLAKMIKNLMDKLIYSAEIINKLSNIVIRKKEQNPLISDDLVSMINQAGSDANNAVALSLVALQSTFAAQASNIESEADSTLELTQAVNLYGILTGTTETLTESINSMYGVPLTFDEKGTRNSTCLVSLIYTAYENASTTYKEAKVANEETIKQLAEATSNLTTAQIKLKSLQSGLAAGNAAALAS